MNAQSLKRRFGGVLAGFFIAGVLSAGFAAPAAAEPVPPGGDATVAELSGVETDGLQGYDGKPGSKKGDYTPPKDDDCKGGVCVPYVFCKDNGKPDGPPIKVDGQDPKARITGEEAAAANDKPGDKPDKPRCLKKPQFKVHADDCCKGKKGGQLKLTYFNPNKAELPALFHVFALVKKGDKHEWAKDVRWGLLKPGKHDLVFKHMPNGLYWLKISLGDCVFHQTPKHKPVKIDCKDKPDQTPTPEPTDEPIEPTVPATPPAAPGNGGGGELAVTGSSPGTTVLVGGSILLLGILFVVGGVYRRRRRPVLTTAGM